MMTPTRQDVHEYVQQTIEKLMQDWDDADQGLGPDSLLFSEIGLESLDAVVLGVTIQEHFGKEMPFAQLFAVLGEKKKDLSVSELADFAYGHLKEDAPAVLPRGVQR